MDKEQLFSIGEVARLFHMSVSSLRHYESINPDSGYRYYSTRQFEVLNTLRYLRALDMPLPEIADFLQNRDVETIEQKLRQQKAVVEQKLAELSRIERKIDHRLSQLQDAKSARLDEIELIQTPACRIVWMEDALYLKSFLDMEPSIRRLEQSQREAVVFLGKGTWRPDSFPGTTARFCFLTGRTALTAKRTSCRKPSVPASASGEATRKRARPMRSCSPFSGRIILPSAAFRARSRSSITV